MVFVGSFNWDKNEEGIYIFELDSITGTLTKTSSVKGILNPSFLTLSTNGNFLYACTDSKTPNAGSISSFKFDIKNKKLSYINSQKTDGENPVYVSVHNNRKWLLNANYTESSISIFPIVEDGSIATHVQHFQFSEGSIDKKRQQKSHLHSAVFSPNFDYAFFTDLGADKIRIFKFENENPKPLQPTEIPEIKSTLGSGPRHLTFHPNGKFVYCIEEMGGSISAYKFENSKFENIQNIATHNKRYKKDFESSDIHISPDGKFLYASNRGKENNIAIFSILEDGRLENIGYQRTKGKHPRTFAMDESGKFLIVANTQTSNLSVFRRDSKTGLLKFLNKDTKIKNASHVIIKKY